MISPAINLADRLSSCNKTLRRVLAGEHKAFNLYVYQAGAHGDKVLSDDETILRYNVNGIELNEAGFKKLAREIDLTTINCLIPEVRSNLVMALERCEGPEDVVGIPGRITSVFGRPRAASRPALGGSHFTA
ncbi:MAG: hypothetical protein JRE18_11000, partial [Deltaproteobacteria bacterium]|nr:hypothetical protein [Deltaproteobacteria bacterium]